MVLIVESKRCLAFFGKLLPSGPASGLFLGLPVEIPTPFFAAAKLPKSSRKHIQAPMRYLVSGPGNGNVQTEADLKECRFLSVVYAVPEQLKGAFS